MKRYLEVFNNRLDLMNRLFDANALGYKVNRATQTFEESNRITYCRVVTHLDEAHQLSGHVYSAVHYIHSKPVPTMVRQYLDALVRETSDALV